MFNRPLAKNGDEYEYARAGGHPKCFQSHVPNLSRSFVFHSKYDLHEAVGIRPHGTPNRVAVVHGAGCKGEAEF